MKVIVLSRLQAQVHIFDEPSVLVAITTPPNAPVEVNTSSGLISTLWLSFADVHSLDQPYAMAPDHAHQLWGSSK